MESSKGRGNVMEKSRMTGVQPLLDFARLSVNQSTIWFTEKAKHEVDVRRLF